MPTISLMGGLVGATKDGIGRPSARLAGDHIIEAVADHVAGTGNGLARPPDGRSVAQEIIVYVQGGQAVGPPVNHLPKAAGRAHDDVVETVSVHVAGRRD